MVAFLVAWQIHKVFAQLLHAEGQRCLGESRPLALPGFPPAAHQGAQRMKAGAVFPATAAEEVPVTEHTRDMAKGAGLQRLLPALLAAPTGKQTPGAPVTDGGTQ